MRKGNTFLGACYKGAQYIGELYKGSTHINSFGFPKTASGASPITLANARAKLLTFNRLSGNAQRTIEIDGVEYSVPSGITLLEYIESSGTQHIDTGIQANPSCTNTTMRVCLTDTTGTTGLFGARGSTSASVRSYNIFGNVSGAAGRFDNVNPSNPYVFTENTWYEIELGHNGLKGTVTVDGTLVSTGGNNMENSEVGRIYIGSFYNNGTPFATKTPAKWGIVQIWKDGANISGIFHPAKKSSNVVGMYDFVSGRFFTNTGTGTFTAGAELPTPSANLGVAGTGDRTDNLFNPDNAGTRYPNGWYSTGNVVSDAPNANRTVTIPCSEGDVFTFKHYTQASGARYFWVYSDTVASGEPCSAMYGTMISTDTITTTAAPSNAKYIGICFWRTTAGKVQSAADDFVVVKGSTAPTAYIPYGVAINERIARNCGCIDMGTLNWNPIGNGCLYSAITGKANGRNIYCSKYPTDQSSMASATSNMHIGGHDGNRVYFKNTSLENTRAAAQADLSGVYLYYQRTTDSEWTAPATHTAYSSAPLRKVGDYADTLDYASGTITRRVGVKVLTGTESIVKGGSRYSHTLAGMLNEGSVRSTNVFCTHFKTSATGTQGDTFKFGAQVYMYPDMTLYPDVTEFKAYLAAQYAAGTPVTIYYPLATATTESITPIHVTPSIGTNYLESANDVAASNIEASYISKTS